MIVKGINILSITEHFLLFSITFVLSFEITFIHVLTTEKNSFSLVSYFLQIKNLEFSTNLEVGQHSSYFFHFSFISIRMGIFEFCNQF